MEYIEAEKLYKKIVREKEQTNEKHNHKQLFDWEVEAYNRVMASLEGDEEAQAFFVHTLDYALGQSKANTWVGKS